MQKGIKLYNRKQYGFTSLVYANQRLPCICNCPEREKSLAIPRIQVVLLYPSPLFPGLDIGVAMNRPDALSGDPRQLLLYKKAAAAAAIAMMPAPTLVAAPVNAGGEAVVLLMG
jgi:hypothetical protein